MSMQVVVPSTELARPRRLSVAYLLWLLGVVGLCGLHRWYCHRRLSAVIYFVTLGLCGVGQVLDWFRIAAMVRRANRRTYARARA